MYLDQTYKNEFEKYEFIISSSQSIIPESKDSIIPSWTGIRALLSNTFAPRMHVGFLPSPVTEYSTAFSAMKNFTQLVGQLKQDALPLFCDEGVFRIVVDIFLQNQDQFRNLIAILGGFHTAKCLQHSIRKYIRGSGLEESRRQTRVFGVKIVDSVLDGTHYMRSLKGLLILANAIEKLKWSVFTQTIQNDSITAFESNVRGLQAAYLRKDSNACKESYKICLEGSMEVHVLYREFTDRSVAASEMVRYLETLPKLVNILKHLISADREGNWKGHLQAIQDMIPVLCQDGSVNYQRYCSLYLEMMRQLPEEHPSIYKELMEGKFVVTTSAGFFNAVAPDMKLEQSIQRFKKGADGIIGQMERFCD